MGTLGITDMVEEVMGLGRSLGASFTHIKRTANSMVDSLAKEGVDHPTSIVSFDDSVNA